MTSAGDLREKIELQAEVSVPDGAGGSTKSWQAQITARAAIKVLKSGETIMAGRLESTQALVVTLRWQSAVAAANTTWRLRNVRTNKIYNIRAITPDAQRAWIDVLCETDAI